MSDIDLNSQYVDIWHEKGVYNYGLLDDMAVTDIEDYDENNFYTPRLEHTSPLQFLDYTNIWQPAKNARPMPHSFRDQGYNIYIDNNRLSLDLCSFLYRRKTNVCGMLNSSKIPEIIRGVSTAFKSTSAYRSGSILCLKQMNRIPLYTLTTIHDKQIAEELKESDKAYGQYRQGRPSAMLCCMKNMRNIDKQDQVIIGRSEIVPLSSNKFTINDVHVIGKHAGYAGAVSKFDGSIFGKDKVKYALAYMKCTGFERSLSQCSGYNSNVTSCNNSYAGEIYSTVSEASGSIRLVGQLENSMQGL
ncbi:hypothetical protein TrispH2_011389 [Trichoplax sp. H2]|nr:hypothetical protein TrispH2_011389 [Trichoplax sp. H2]|eukprot:RDD37086.1 hypothetical protein TrispH2_011389 [Trichoplax sp. H2]